MAQTAPNVSATPAVSLSPFVVSAEKDVGYRAANTLSGTRLNSELFSVPASISVLTKELLDDIGAEKTEDFLKFAVSADHNLGGDPLINTSQNVDVQAKIRGFAGASITRDYFPLGLSTDRFNIDRIDLNRGPNSVLYGIGSPGGVINSSSKRALLNARHNEVSFTAGSWSKIRSELDVSIPIVRDRLAVRINTLYENRDGWRDFEFYKQKGLALATTFQPLKHTQIRANVERMIRKQNLPPPYPSQDWGGTKWAAAGALLAGNPLLASPNPAPELLRFRTLEQVMFAPQLRTQAFRISTIGGDMRPDLPGVQAAGYWETIPGPTGPVAGTIDDPYYGQQIPKNANLLGPGATTNHDYSVPALFLEQRVGDLHLELAYSSLGYRRNRRIPTANGLIGDANPILPGAYLADGDSRVAAGRLPGSLLPDIAAPNPRSGDMYVEGISSETFDDNDARHWRGTLAYELNLLKVNRWLGQHSLAGVWQRSEALNRRWSQREYNLAPNNNQLIDSVTNIVFRRTYIDFGSPDGPRGALDPWSTPIPVSPGMRAGFAGFGNNPWRSEDIKTWMIAGQSRFWADRLVVTGGYREDKQETNVASGGAERLPNSTNLYTKFDTNFSSATARRFSGSTTTLGVVLSPWKWIGFTYNQSDSIQPQNSQDILGRYVGPVNGIGKDYGVRLNLLGNKVYLSANTYRTDEENKNYEAAITPRTLAVPALQSIIDTLLIQGSALPKSMADLGIRQLQPLEASREQADSAGSGFEIELTGEITRGWSVSVNYSRNKIALTNIGPAMNEFLAEVKGSWDGNPAPVNQTNGNVANFVRQRDNTPDRDFVLNPATFNDSYDYAADVIASVNAAEGQVPLQNVEESFNFFTSYRFAAEAPSMLKNSRIGLGGNFRAAPVIGYNIAQNNVPIEGKRLFLVTLMLGKKFPLRKGQSIDLQLNIQNLLGEEDLLPYSAESPTRIVRYILPRTLRSWDLRAIYRF